MRVISVVSPKGGVGKTTTGLILAGEIADAGGKVSIIDADPNTPFKLWSSLSGPVKNIKVVTDVTEDSIVDEIEAAKGHSKFVIVDLEGTANMTVSYAIAHSDFALVPTQGSQLDAIEAVKAVKQIRRVEKGFKIKIPHALVFTRTSAAITPRTYKHIYNEMQELGMDILDSQVIDREAYRALFSIGGTLHGLKTSDVSNLPAAKENAAALIEEIIKKMAPKKAKRKKKAA
ncbi:MAG TPA: ParA family protein [Rhodospirillales bacterium]|nr:ParA family protein [Rhodospirillales bacterium]